MIDFGSLVLGPAMATFGQAVTVTPLKSQPSAAAYAAPGVYDLKPVTVQLEGSDDFHQTFQHELGIRVSDYGVLPAQGDAIATAQGAFVVYDVIADGQGGAKLVLRQVPT